VPDDEAHREWRQASLGTQGDIICVPNSSVSVDNGCQPGLPTLIGCFMVIPA
ncbi:hypothetical protein G3M48_002803, partial [Beauveria asiatica]